MSKREDINHCRTCLFFGWGRNKIGGFSSQGYICKRKPKESHGKRLYPAVEGRVYYAADPYAKACEDYEPRAEETKASK